MRLNKLIFYTSFEIVCLLALILTSYFVWNKLDDVTAKIAYSYTFEKEKIYINLENKISYLTPINDTDYSENNKITIKINNPSNSKKRYILYTKVNNDNIQDVKYIKLFLEDKIKYLGDLENFKKDNSTYYLIKTDFIKSTSNKDINLYLWLSNETPNIEENKEINFEFSIEEI